MKKLPVIFIVDTDMNTDTIEAQKAELTETILTQLNEQVVPKTVELDELVDTNGQALVDALKIVVAEDQGEGEYLLALIGEVYDTDTGERTAFARPFKDEEYLNCVSGYVEIKAFQEMIAILEA